MLLFYVLVKVCEIPTSTYAPVAQSVEQLPFKEMVVGSIPTGRTIHNLVGKLPRAPARGDEKGVSKIRIGLASKCEFGGRAESKK